jgi:titin
LAQVQANTYTVTTTADSGPGSLRQAMLSANAHLGADVIRFSIAGPGPYTISPVTALPDGTDPVTIDGSTQPGFAGQPLIELDGSNGGSMNGLNLSAKSTIRGLLINRFKGDGINGYSDGNVIQGNFIGVDPTGRLPRGNSYWGIWVYSGKNLVGGVDVAMRNVISGNGAHGVGIQGSAAMGNLVQGNFIGVTADGKSPLGNADGVQIYQASGNTIGGSASGAGNVISGNTRSGVEVTAGSDGNAILGNLIGVDSSGGVPLGNAWHGVLVSAGANNVVGGTPPGARNVISGNSSNGIALDQGSSKTVIQGNIIGLDASGAAALGNGQDGVFIYGSSNNVVGGTSPDSRNILSGNTFSGLELALPEAMDNQILGNLIGTDSTGTKAAGNKQAGVNVSGSRNNSIGPGNVVSANGLLGVQLWNGAMGNQIRGNLIGTDIAGTARLGNAQPGINVLDASNNTIGGSQSGAGNVISANGLSGIIMEAQAKGNLVLGNFLGTDKAGMKDLGNDEDGIFLNGASGNSIGSSDPAGGNLISANGHKGSLNNGRSGIEIWNGASNNAILGNRIGTDATGNPSLGNAEYGVFILDSSNNRIGGSANEGNTLASNQKDGVYVQSGTGNSIRGNSMFSNGGMGIRLGPGANKNQTTPTLTSARVIGGVVEVIGTLQTSPNAKVSLEFFANNTSDPALAEGETFLFRTGELTADAQGKLEFAASSTNGFVMAGQSITATATDA